ncbi:MAG: hypothetical protein PHQ14_12465 [Chromatiales bacterium]|jgi:hypothetical protein|nr:hypothetical protein [Chromatiales bacterium]MDX9767830.1 hypothetical protein [Ectothiorhodospiraceae bacterium]
MKESIILFLMSLLATCTIPGGIGGDDGSIDVGQDTIPIINNGVHRIIKSGDTLTYRVNGEHRTIPATTTTPFSGTETVTYEIDTAHGNPELPDPVIFEIHDVVQDGGGYSWNAEYLSQSQAGIYAHLRYIAASNMYFWHNYPSGVFHLPAIFSTGMQWSSDYFSVTPNQCVNSVCSTWHIQETVNVGAVEVVEVPAGKFEVFPVYISRVATLNSLATHNNYGLPYSIQQDTITRWYNPAYGMIKEWRDSLGYADPGQNTPAMQYTMELTGYTLH